VTPPEVACVFGRATGEHLLAVERFVLALPNLFRDDLLEVDLACRVPLRLVVLVSRFAPVDGALPAGVHDRLAFWAARVGGRTSIPSSLGGSERDVVRANLAACELVERNIRPAALLEASNRFFTAAGAPTERRRSAAEVPRLSMDASGPGWKAATYDPAARQLFLAAPLAPPVGDVVALSVRVPGTNRPLAGTGTVVRVRPPEDALPGQPAGFALEIAPAPVMLHDALAAFSERATGGEARVAPRFPARAPVEVVPDPHAAPDVATITYASEAHLRQDYLENLSQGGAYVRRALPPPVGTPVTLKIALPSGLDLQAKAVVAYRRPGGMGLRFELDAETRGLLSGAIAQISGRPRRALVVDDDALQCRMYADALAEQGFDVLTASSGEEGLRVLSEELLALDLLLTDVMMPGMDGEAFVRTIRRAGGEADLAIVAVTARFEAALEEKLQAAGADAVLDKALGPTAVAKAADAVIERKRTGPGQA
jgi:CheY-like chemotaxis protein